MAGDGGDEWCFQLPPGDGDDEWWWAVVVIAGGWMWLVMVVMSGDPSSHLVMGWICVDSSSFGNWCTYLWISFPILGALISSPISFGPRSYSLRANGGPRGQQGSAEVRCQGRVREARSRMGSGVIGIRRICQLSACVHSPNYCQSRRPLRQIQLRSLNSSEIRSNQANQPHGTKLLRFPPLVGFFDRKSSQR